MRTDPYCPWEAADRLGVTVTPTRLDHARGYTNGSNRIWIDERLTGPEQRCTLTHELFHIIHGHVGRQPPPLEEKIRRCTARWLIPWPALMRAVDDQLHAHDIADALGVTTEVLQDRLHFATPDEHAQLERTTTCALSAA